MTYLTQPEQNDRTQLIWSLFFLSFRSNRVSFVKKIHSRILSLGVIQRLPNRAKARKEKGLTFTGRFSKTTVIDRQSVYRSRL